MMDRTTVAVVFLCALFLTACGADGSGAAEAASSPPVGVWTVTTPSEQARRHVEEGLRILDMNGLPNNRPFNDAANEHFKRAVAEDPSFSLAYLLAGVSAPSLEEYRANLAQAREHAPEASEVEQLLVDIEERLFERDLEGARELTDRLLELEPSNPRAWMRLSRVQGIAGDELAARRSADRAVEVAPDFTHGHLWLANSYLIYEPVDWTAAERHVQLALELEPNQAAPHDLAGDLHRAHGRFEEAAAAYTRAAELDPTDAGVLLQRGHVYTFAGDYDRARADYDAASERGRKTLRATPLLYRALVSAFAGDYEASVTEFSELNDRIERLGLPDPEGFRLQLIYFQTTVATLSGQIDAARRAMEQANAIWRSRIEQVGTDDFRRAREADIAYWDGFLAIHEGDRATARARAEEVRRLLIDDRDPSKDRPVHAILGLTALDQGDHSTAVAHLEQADPNDPYLTYQRARALEGAGRLDEAHEIYRALATSNFNTPELSYVRRQAEAKLAG